MPVSRSPGGNLREEANDDLPSGSRPSSFSQSGITTRGRAMADRVEPIRMLIGSSHLMSLVLVDKIPALIVIT